jgi:hypothetical protein
MDPDAEAMPMDRPEEVLAATWLVFAILVPPTVLVVRRWRRYRVLALCAATSMVAATAWCAAEARDEIFEYQIVIGHELVSPMVNFALAVWPILLCLAIGRLFGSSVPRSPSTL